MASNSCTSIYGISGTNDSVELVTFVHRWTIDNFSYRNYQLDSLHFPFSKELECQFYLCLDDNKLSCILLEDSGMAAYGTLNAHVKASFIDLQGEKRFTKEIRHQFCFRNSSWDIANFLSREVILNPVNRILSQINYLTTNSPFIVSIVKDPVQTAFVPSIIDTNSLIESIGSLTIEKDYKSLLTSGKLSDIVLVVGGQLIPAHKTILSARSKVFAAMFEYDSKEKQENRVVITDVKAQVFEELLQFIYTGKITSNVLDQYAEELLTAAYKYQLVSLKDICESALCLKLSIESSPSFLVLADMHNAQKLKAKALEFLRDNAYDTIQALFNSNDSELVAEAFRDLANKIANKKN